MAGLVHPVKVTEVYQPNYLLCTVNITAIKNMSKIIQVIFLAGIFNDLLVCNKCVLNNVDMLCNSFVGENLEYFIRKFSNESTARFVTCPVTTPYPQGTYTCKNSRKYF